jgi:tetraacyldisaccharide 4'-kinase
MLKKLRYILAPLSVVYGFVIGVRNKLYDRNILRSATFNFPLICVGNLSLGGTGKTPMTEYLIRLLNKKYSVATLSRGYKRKTKGFAIADNSSTPIDIGDEPMQLHKKFANITVAVAEERIVGIPQLLHAKPGTQVIILDDAFQHREIKAGLNILLTECENLYTRDLIVPAGNLRDVKQSSARADIIVISKCKAGLNEIEKQDIVAEINPLDHQQVFFTKIEYGNPYHLFSKEEKLLKADTDALLICGIANPAPLKEWLDALVHSYKMLSYKDHHIFNTDDLEEIKKQFSALESTNKIILTPEKDGLRLAKYVNELKHLPIYVLPMRHKFLFGEEDKFNSQVISFIDSFQRKDENNFML